MDARSGVLVLRAWVEPEFQAPCLRVRIMIPQDDGTEPRESFATSSGDEAVAFVAEWLALFAGTECDG